MSKTIEIDQDAYDLLERSRNRDEDWSQVIRRCVRPKRSLEEIIDAFERADLSECTLDAIDDSVSRRRNIAYQPKA